MTEQTHSGSTSSHFDDIEDLPIKHTEIKKVAVCTVCFRKSIAYTHSHKKSAITLCLSCDIYLCERCADDHRCRWYVSPVPDNILAENIVDEMLSENNREEEFSKIEICVLDRVHVATTIDKWLCDISGICGLGDLHWVACDARNYCIKIFSWKNNNVKRYIRFKSKPYDVTEIEYYTHGNDSERTKDENNSDGSFKMEDHLNSIAVTFPIEHTILILEISTSQIIKKKELKTEHYCFSIEFYEDQIFVVCKEDSVTDLNYMYTICIKSLDGETLKVIKSNVKTIFPPYIKVQENGIYVTDNWRHRILLISDEGTMINEKQIEGFGPRGITVDTQNNVYVTGHWPGKVYKLNKELEQCNALGLKGEINMEKAWAICFHKEKLIVSHWTSSLENYVTIINLL